MEYNDLTFMKEYSDSAGGSDRRAMFAKTWSFDVSCAPVDQLVARIPSSETTPVVRYVTWSQSTTLTVSDMNGLSPAASSAPHLSGHRTLSNQRRQFRNFRRTTPSWT